MAENSNSNIEHKKYYYENGKKSSEPFWLVNIKEEHYFLNGNFHRADGPAIICYYPNGNIRSEHYYVNGNRHRIYGPAVIYYHKNGNIKLKFNYIDGKKIG
jgi:antitoxin component YwqK of YwqJK toxin-antitoxin module